MGMKKIINKFFIILVVFFVSLIFFNVSISLKAASNSELNYGSEKIYTDVSINEEFDDDSVLVVMKKEISEVNKEYSMDFFGDFGLNKSHLNVILNKGNTKMSEYLGVLKQYKLCLNIQSGKNHYFKCNLEELDQY